ncbi:hypothetical protein XELAEV_18000594mg [Xenopus laevis]|nr:hypothetical protein XELAEV_18000594mg [Xenopus laevis]
MSGIQKVSADSAPGPSMDVGDRASRLNEILRWAQFEAGEEDLLLLNRACLRSAAVTPTGSESPPSEEATSPAPPSFHPRAPAGHASLKRSSTRSAKPAAKRSHTAPPGRLARKKPSRTGSAPPLPALDAAVSLLPSPSNASNLMPPPTSLRHPAPPPCRKSSSSGSTNRQPPSTPAGVCSASRSACLLTALPASSGSVAPPPPPPLTAPASPSAAPSSTTSAWPSMTPPPLLGPSSVDYGGAASSSALSSSSISSTVLDPENRGSFRAVASPTAPVTAPQPGLALQYPPQNDLASVAIRENFTSQDIGNSANAQFVSSLLRLLAPGAASTQASAGAPEAAFRDSILCDTTPLGLHLSQSIKEKINRGDYVDLLSLLPSVKVFLKDKTNDSEEDRRRPVARTFTNWLQSFCIYANILCSKHPQLGASMFKHVDIVLEAYKSYGGIAWFIYEDKFRQKMAVQRSIPWGSKDIDLWMGMMVPRPVVSPPGVQKPGQKYNTCWAYNDSACKWQSNCKFKHECSHCGGNHPAFRCVKKFITMPNKLLSKEAGKLDNSGEASKYASLSKSVSKPQDGNVN